MKLLLEKLHLHTNTYYIPNVRNGQPCVHDFDKRRVALA